MHSGIGTYTAAPSNKPKTLEHNVEVNLPEFRNSVLIYCLDDFWINVIEPLEDLVFVRVIIIIADNDKKGGKDYRLITPVPIIVAKGDLDYFIIISKMFYDKSSKPSVYPNNPVDSVLFVYRTFDPRPGKDSFNDTTTPTINNSSLYFVGAPEYSILRSDYRLMPKKNSLGCRNYSSASRPIPQNRRGKIFDEYLFDANFAKMSHPLLIFAINSF